VKNAPEFCAPSANSRARFRTSNHVALQYDYFQDETLPTEYRNCIA
jgi:hypothetical protein